jgi:hypothetical protein
MKTVVRVLFQHLTFSSKKTTKQLYRQKRSSSKGKKRSGQDSRRRKKLLEQQKRKGRERKRKRLGSDSRWKKRKRKGEDVNRRNHVDGKLNVVDSSKKKLAKENSKKRKRLLVLQLLHLHPLLRLQLLSLHVEIKSLHHHPRQFDHQQIDHCRLIKLSTLFQFPAADLCQTVLSKLRILEVSACNIMRGNSS